MNEIGPVQVLVVDFGPEAKLEGRMLAELERLEAIGTVRVLDLLFVGKDSGSGDLLALDVQGEELGAIAGALLGFEFDTRDDGPDVAVRVGEGAFGLSREDLVAIAAALEPGRSAAVLLIEHVWARDLKRALSDAGGVPVAEGFLTPEALDHVANDLAAVSSAMDEAPTEPAAAGSREG